MQFSTFQKNLDNWQGSSLIFGVLEEEIASQLENIKFVVDPKLLLKKITQKKFKVNNISNQNKQFELFGSNVNTSINFQHSNNLKINGEILTKWR